MVNPQTLRVRAEKIADHKKTLADFYGISFKDFMVFKQTQDIVEYNLFQIMNHLIDMVYHVAVDEDLGHPQSAYEAAECLRKYKIFSKADLEVFRNMIGFRNVISHDYVNLNKKIVYGILTKGLKDVDRLVSKICKKFL